MTDRNNNQDICVREEWQSRSNIFVCAQSVVAWSVRPTRHKFCLCLFPTQIFMTITESRLQSHWGHAILLAFWKCPGGRSLLSLAVLDDVWLKRGTWKSKDTLTCRQYLYFFGIPVLSEFQLPTTDKRIHERKITALCQKLSVHTLKTRYTQITKNEWEFLGILIPPKCHLPARKKSGTQNKCCLSKISVLALKVVDNCQTKTDIFWSDDRPTRMEEKWSILDEWPSDTYWRWCLRKIITRTISQEEYRQHSRYWALVLDRRQLPKHISPKECWALLSC